MELGTSELLIILVIVFLLFGVGRISRIGGEIGQGLREFRHGLRGDDEPESTSTPNQRAEDHQPASEEQKTASEIESKAE